MALDIFRFAVLFLICARLVDSVSSLTSSTLYEDLDKENKALKSEKIINIQTIDKLKKKITDMEEITTKNNLVEVSEKDSEDLDLSFGPRFCKKCDHEAKDGYQLDAHHWSEHDEENEDNFVFHCQQCDERFKTLKDLMIHKKIKHVENVDFCWHFSSGFCSWGERCWFKHELNSHENKREQDMKLMKCNICDKTFNAKKHLMIHIKNEHEENIEICKLFQKGNCSYNEKCCFSHKN